MFYYCVFFISSFFIKLSTFFNNKNSRIIKIFFIALGILTLSIISGIRSYSIGTDTLNYNLTYGYASTSVNLLQYCKELKYTNGTEYGFSVLSYFVAMTGLSPHWFYFICQFLIAINVYIALNMLSDKLSLTLGWMTYCFMFYTSSFNILRQIISLSFILLSVSFLYKNKKIQSLVMLVIAYLFHTSSVIGIIIYATGYIVIYIKDKRKRVAGVALVVGILVMLPKTIGFLNTTGALSDKYSEYLTEGFNAPILVTICSRLPMIILLIYCLIINKNRRQDIFIYLLVVFELIMLPLQNMSSAVARLLLCFGITKVIGYPLILRNMGIKSIPIEYITKILFIVYLGIIFYLQVIQNNNGMVYPYVIAN